MDTVQSTHTLDDVSTIKKAIRSAKLLVRCNPIHPGSGQEIETIIQNGADIIMLPYFKSVNEAAAFLNYVNGRVKTCLLVETPEAVDRIEGILALDGIDEIHIGLNDLHLAYHKKFMFELLTDGTVEMLCNKFRQKGIPYGFGGIARLGKGALPAECVIKEHYSSALRGLFYPVAFVIPILLPIWKKWHRSLNRACTISERLKKKFCDIRIILKITESLFLRQFVNFRKNSILD